MRISFLGAAGITCAAVVTPVVASQADSNGVIDDSSLNILARNFFFNRDMHDGASNNRGSSPNGYRQEWAQAFIATYQSGFSQGAVGFGLDSTAFVGIRLDSGAGRTGTGLLPVDTDGEPRHDFSAIGGALKMRISNTVFKAGNNLMPTAPVFAPAGARLIPGWVSGFMLSSDEISKLNIDAGHFTSGRDQTSSNTDGRIRLAYDFGGVVDVRDVDYLGATYNLNPNISSSFYYGRLADVWDQYYNKTVFVLPLDAQQAVGMTFHGYHTTDTGSAKAGKIDSNAWSLGSFYSQGGHTLTVSFESINSDLPFDFVAFDGQPYQPGGTLRLANAMQFADFNGPHENSWQLRYDLNMAAYGVPGLSFMGRYTRGSGIDGSGIPDNSVYARIGYGDNGRHWERDLQIAYVVQNGKAKGMSIALRQATHRSNTDQRNGDVDDVRMIIDMPFKVF